MLKNDHYAYRVTWLKMTMSMFRTLDLGNYIFC